MKQKMSHPKANPQLFLFLSLLEIALKPHSVSCSSLCVCILFTKQFKSVQAGQLLKAGTWNCSKVSVVSKEQAVRQHYVTICRGHVWFVLLAGPPSLSPSGKKTNNWWVRICHASLQEYDIRSKLANLCCLALLPFSFSLVTWMTAFLLVNVS